MRRKATALGGQCVITLWTIFAVVGLARNAAADGCYMSGPGFIHPQAITDDFAFSQSIQIYNDIFLFNGGVGVGAVPCLYDVVWAGNWFVVYADKGGARVPIRNTCASDKWGLPFVLPCQCAESAMRCTLWPFRGDHRATARWKWIPPPR